MLKAGLELLFSQVLGRYLRSNWFSNTGLITNTQNYSLDTMGISSEPSSHPLKKKWFVKAKVY